MRYLDELRRMEEESEKPQVAYRQKGQKPEKPPFDPFGSTPSGVSQNFTSEVQDPLEPGDSALEDQDVNFSDTPGALPTKPTEPIWWRIHRDGEFLCVLMDPMGISHDEALKLARDKWPASEIEVGR